MKERPILFSGEMIRAILDGSKSQTRRVVKYIPALGEPYEWCPKLVHPEIERVIGDFRTYCPYGQPGDRLWVRETWTTLQTYDHRRPSEGSPVWPIYYHADKSHGKLVRWTDEEQELGKLRPSIFMPRWASRITLEVTEVRVERVQEITEEDSRAEGITDGGCFRCGNPEPCGCSNPIPCARDSYAHLWNKINAKRGHSWESNPWVWVVSFKRIAT